VGVFGNDAMESGIPADVWRFYIYYNRPEKNDTTFMWNDFKEKVNGELLGNFSNLVNRTLSFIHRFYDGKVPAGTPDAAFTEAVKNYTTRIDKALDAVDLRNAFRLIFELSSLGNKRFQDSEPWRTRTEAPEQAAILLQDLVYLVRDLAVLLHPFLPTTAEKTLSFLGIAKPSWSMLGTRSGIELIRKPELLFEKLEDKRIDELRARFSGTQAERLEEEKKVRNPLRIFREKILLLVGKITAIERHPKADKLYVETIDLGGGDVRTIVSGLVPYYTEDELLNKQVIVAANLAPVKLRGVESRGMLLAAEDETTVEVLFVPDASPGDRVSLAGEEASEPSADTIDIDTFFSVPLTVDDHTVVCGETALVIGDTQVRTAKVKTGKVR
ncbi:MAG TPA: methionine--tRNA ligase, partial [Spirochaetia bacterium]|nr:methionine--tRNA ligase [Spirochaetia bacterium]